MSRGNERLRIRFNVGGSRHPRPSAFTLLELCVVIGFLALGALALAPAFTRTKTNSKGIQCLYNLRRFTGAWTMYAMDYSERLANNFGVSETLNEINSRTYRNWANHVLDWTTAQMNTNTDLLRAGVLGPYFTGDFGVHRCPADEYRSPAQIAQGWSSRTRSISMNSVLGRYSMSRDSTANGLNTFLPQYVQYLKQGRIPKPAQTWVVLDEHPDSINEGYFLNNPTTFNWQDIPASYHNGGCGFSFADGHAEMKKWLSTTSRYGVRFNYPPTRPFDASGKLDFAWVLQRTGYVDAKTGKPAFGY